MKKIFLILLIIFTGCTNIKDINNLAIVSEITIDYDKKYLINLKILKNNSYEIISNTCTRLDECFINISSKISKKMYLTHLELLIISNNISDNQFKEIINFFLKEDTSRNSFDVIIVENINEELLKKEDDELKNMINLSINSNGLVKSKTLDDVIKDILNIKISYVPYIDNNYEIVGYKRINKNDKLLSKEESIIVNFIFNYIKSISILVNNKTYKLEDCETSYQAKNKLTIKINCNSNSKDTYILRNYLSKLLNNYINNNKLYYIDYLKNKYGISNNDIDTLITINQIKIDKGEHFE